MKKLFSVFAAFCFALFGGVMMSACGEQDFYTITIEENTYVDVQVYVGTELLSAEEDGTYIVENGANVTVRMYAKNLMESFPEINVSVNGEEKNVFKNGEFGNGDTYYGWFTLPMKQVKSDVNITFTVAEE